MIELSDVYDFRDLPERLIMPRDHGHVSCSAVQLSLCWKSLQSLTDGKKFAGDEESQKVEMKRGETFEMEPTLLFYDRAPGY